MKTHVLVTKKQKQLADEAGITRINQIKLFRFLDIHNGKTAELGIDNTTPLGYAQNYFKEIFKGKYYEQFLKPAKKIGLIKSDEKIGAGAAKYYWVNPETNNSELVKVPVVKDNQVDNLKKNQEVKVKRTWYYDDSLTPSPLTDSSLTTSPFYGHGINHLFEKHTIDAMKANILKQDLLSLKVDKDKIIKAAEAYVNKIGENLTTFSNKKMENTVVVDENPTTFSIGDVTDLPKQVEITDRIYGGTYRRFTSSAVSEADNIGAVLIRYERKYFIDNLENFIRMKRAFIMKYVEQCIVSVQDEDLIYFKRNETNGRLDHNLTSMPEFMVDIILEDNGLVEIDISNSQFAIHAYWLKKLGLLNHKDVALYYDLAVSGKLYTELANMVGVNRSKAKMMMMELAFSSERKNTDSKKLFDKHFPNVMEQMVGFKKEQKQNMKENKQKRGTEMFSVNLAQLEGEMVVDNILPNIKDKGMFCLTKHDSIIVRKSDLDEVLRILSSFFNAIDFECTLKVDEKEIAIRTTSVQVEDNESDILDFVSKLNLEKVKLAEKPAVELNPIVSISNYNYKNPYTKN